MNYNIVINTDDNYIQHTMAMLCSLYVNNSKHELIIHVLTHQLSEQNIFCIKELSERYGNSVIIYIINEAPLDGVQFRKIRPLSKAAYYRLLLSSIIDEGIDKILYLDCDMIVLKDISPLFSIDLENYALAATGDYMPTNDVHRMQLNLEFDDRTFCSGIMLVNLKFWRENNSEVELLNFAKKWRDPVFLHDQDVLNYVFKKKWFRLPPKYNRIVFNIIPGGSLIGYKKSDIIEYHHSPVVIHYANKVKPWFNIWMPMRSHYRYYLKKSCYKNIKYDNVSFGTKVKYYNLIFRYVYDYYILPYLPQVLLLMFHDIHLVYEVLFHPTRVHNNFYLKKFGIR